jgi:hypothetical protein
MSSSPCQKKFSFLFQFSDIVLLSNILRLSDSQNGGKKFKESERFLQPAPKTRANDSHGKMRTPQHWSRPQKQLPKKICQKEKIELKCDETFSKRNYFS